MPLLNRQEVGGAGPLPKPGGGGLKPTDDVFVIEYTGDALKSYAEFADKHHQHSLPQWTDRYYGKGGLTYQDALAYEKHAEEQLRKQFPKALEGDAVRLIHHSTLRKDDLVSRLSEALKGALPGDSDQRSAAAGADEQQAAAAAQQGTDAAAKRAGGGVTKKLLTHFLLYVADKQKPGVWVCKEPWVRKYGLKAELPEGLQPPPAAAAAAAADAAGPSSPGPSGTASTREGTPMKSPTRPEAAEAPRTLEEEEARLKPGTAKAIAFAVMKARGVTAPVTAEDIVRITTIDGSRVDWTDKSKRNLTSVLAQDAAFVRVARGQYTLRCWEADLPALPADTPGASGGGGKAAAKAAAKGGEAKEGAEAPASGGEQSSLARAEQVLAQALKAVAARQGDATAAKEALDACVKRLADAKAEAAKAKQSPAKGGGGGGAVAPSPNKDELDAKFALPKHLQDFTGHDDDRKAKLLWRQEKAAEEKRLAQERAAYVQQLRLDAAKASRAGTDQLQAALDRAKKAAEDAAAKLVRARKAEEDARRGVAREKQKEMLKDVREKSKADKEKQKQADKEMREKRRQEALAAKRYPIDDLELLSEELTAAAAAALTAPSNGGGKKQKQQQQLQPSQLLPLEQTDLPCIRAAQPLGDEASQQLSRALYVADTLTQFAKQLGVKGASLAELEGMLDAAAAAAAVGGANLGGDGAVAREALQWLACTYQRLLKVLLRDVTDVEGAARVYSRWEEALDSSAGAWPDVLRRWVQTQAQEGMASPDARGAAEFLRTHDAAGLTKQQHLALLTQLLDDVLDTHLMRGLLATRLEEAHEAAAGLREQLTEARRKLREAQDEERELKKRKRAAALALATAAAERQLRELGQLHAGDAAAADGGDEDGDAAAAAAAAAAAGGSGGKEREKDAKQKEVAKIKAARKEIMERAGLSKDKVSLAELEAELADRDEVEPSWELPDELLEYSGPVGDKKAMSEFRRKQQEERKRLDKAKAKWHSEKSKRAKERAEARKREVEQEKVVTRERAKAEEEVTELADKFEAQEGRYAVRRQPLGSDRFNRCYWWGLAGARDALLLQQEAGAADATLGLLAAAAVEGAQAAAAAPSASTLMAGAFGGKQQDAAAAGSSGGGSAAAPGEQAQQQQRASQGPGAVVDHAGLSLPRGAEAWALLEGPEAVESLMGCCEVRGVREKELKASLDKMLPAMSAAMAKAAAAKAAAASAAADADGAAAAADEDAAGDGKGGAAAGKKKGGKKEAAAPQEAPVAHRALPSRHARSAAAEQIRKTGTAAPKEKEASAAAAAMAAAGAAAMGGDEEDATGPFFGWQLAAVKSAVGSLAQLTQPAAAAKVAVRPPATAWAQYRQQLQGLVHGEVPDTWQAATTAAAIELLTGRPQADTAAPAAAGEAGKDAAWARAVAAAGATPADAHGDDEAAARHAVLSQLRLQLLLWEQQLVAASGEGRYLDQEGGNVVWGSEDAEEESEGEAADNAGDEDDDSMDVDEPPQQQQQLAAAAAGKGSKGKAAADAKAARGLKRAGSSNVEAAADAAHEAPANKRRKAGAAAAEASEAAAAGSGGRKGAAAAGLPPRPAARGKARGGSGGGAAAAAAAEAPSREGSAAPANSGAPAGAAGGSRQKRGRGAPAAAAASDGDAGASRDEGDDEAATGGRGKKAARVKAPAAAAAAGRGGRGKAAAAADSGELEGSEDAGVSEEVVKGRRLAHLKVLQGEQDDDPDEEVADADTELTHLPTQVRGRAVWRSSEERDSWRACVAASATAAGLAYCAAALTFHAQQPLAVMAARSKKAGGGKAKAAAAEQQHAAAAAGSSKGHARRK